MSKWMVLTCLLFLLANSAFAGPARGIAVPQVPPPTSIDADKLTAELAAMQPFWQSGDWNKVTVSVGLGWVIKSSVKSDWYTPDQVTVFTARVGTEGPVQGEYAFGATVDWDVAPPYLQVYVGGLKSGDSVGWSLGMKGTLFQVGW